MNSIDQSIAVQYLINYILSCGDVSMSKPDPTNVCYKTAVIVIDYRVICSTPNHSVIR